MRPSHVPSNDFKSEIPDFNSVRASATTQRNRAVRFSAGTSFRRRSSLALFSESDELPGLPESSAALNLFRSRPIFFA